MKKFNDILDTTAFQENIVQYSNVFNFKDITRNAAQNETWRDTTSDTLWNILDACGKDINNIVADGAINYVRNISDINTCRIPALASIAKMLSKDVGGLLSLYMAMPTKLQLLIDIFSIDREYLFGGNSQILSIPLIRELMQRLRDSIIKILPSKRTAYEKMALDDIFKEFVDNNHAISDTNYKKFLHSVFKRFIVDVLASTYSPTDDTTIVDNLLFRELKNYTRYGSLPTSTIIDDVIMLRSRHPLDLETTVGTNIPLDNEDVNTLYDSLGKQIKALQKSLNVSDAFDPWQTADYINEHGISPTHELTTNEIVLVEAILNAHNKERFDYAKGTYLTNNIDTRFAYYREKEFMSYLGAFMYIYETNVNAISSDDSISANTSRIVDNDGGISSLDFYNYVDKEWIYENSEDVEITNRATGEIMISKIVGMRDCNPKFIPRVNEDEFYVNPEYRIVDSGDESFHREERFDKVKKRDAIDRICDKLVQFMSSIHFTRNQLKRQAQFNSMRGTGSLLAHAINDYLLTAFPTDDFEGFIPKWSGEDAYRKEIAALGTDLSAIDEKNKQIAENIRLFRNYTNVSIVEYMDTTEYFNIRPTSNPDELDFSLSKRYWEKSLRSITNRDEAQIGVLTPNDIREFYRKSLSMGSLHVTPEVNDDVEEFLISLYETGATDVSVNPDTGLKEHPINDTANDDSLFAYSNSADRAEVQNNSELQAKQDDQYLRYTGNTDLDTDSKNRFENMGDIINSFNWKNVKYSSVMLHPFLYTFRLWNPLVNIIINAFSSYSCIDLEKSLTDKYVFDELFGLFGETKNFWKYNIIDYSGYVTRYEQEKHSAVDVSNEISPLTGYDGVFYPSAIMDFVEAYNTSYEDNKQRIGGTDDQPEYRYFSREKSLCPQVDIIKWGIDSKGNATYERRNPTEDNGPLSLFVCDNLTKTQQEDAYSLMWLNRNVDEDIRNSRRETFEQIIASIFWQIEFWNPAANGLPIGKERVLNPSTPPDEADNRKYRTFYGRWYSHLGYSAQRLRKIAKQLWYWRERIVDAALHRYEVCNYNLDIANNSFFLIDTFHDEDNPDAKLPEAIQALDFNIAASNSKAMETICENNNTNGGYCFLDNQRPKELWIRWNAEPIAMPAFDIYWDNELLPERNGNYLSQVELPFEKGSREEFGQIQYKDSKTNDVFSDVIETFIDAYKVEPDKTLMKGNKAPIFYSFQQSADYIIFASWNKKTSSNSGGRQLNFAGNDRTHLTPTHIACKEIQEFSSETQSYSYMLLPFADDLKSIDTVEDATTGVGAYLSAPYVVCATRGSIIIPSYRIRVPRSFETNIDNDDVSDEENQYVLQNQTIEVRFDEFVCQVVNTKNFESTKKYIAYEPKKFQLNNAWFFGGEVMISRNTNIIFSICDNILDNTARIGFAFLGNLTQRAREQLSINSADGVTRYSADSDPTATIALLRRKFYKAWSDEPIDDQGTPTNDRLYIDERIYDGDGSIYKTKVEGKTGYQPTTLWNSFDRNDKYLCVIGFDKDFTETLWRTADPDKEGVFEARTLNVISDASYIPNFAYQSPHSFEKFPTTSGINKLYKSEYFSNKDHWSVQLLGLENKLLLDYTKLAQDLIIRDETDNVDTFINPGKVTEAIYRIWEQSDLISDEGRIEKLYNPQMILEGDEGNKQAIWTEQWELTEAGIEEMLDRYLTLVRCDSHNDGRILNEKNWVLKTIPIRQLIDDIASQDRDGYFKLSLDKFHTEALSQGGKAYGLTSHIFVGTQDPYSYDLGNSDWATTLSSPAYLLQYGNGIAGVRQALLRVELSKKDDYTGDYPYLFTVEVTLLKKTREDTESDDMATFIDRTNIIPRRSLLMLISQDDTTHMADYHMLTHHGDIFYNVPFPDEDEKLRADSPNDDIKNDPRLDPANKPAKNFLDFLYIYEGSTAFKINEQSDKFGTFDWEHPMNPIDELLYNFRKDQVDLNCLTPWSTYITETIDPKQAELKTVGMDVVQAPNCRANEALDKDMVIGNLILSTQPDGQYRSPTIDITGLNEVEAIKKLVQNGYMLHTWEGSIGNSSTTYQVFNIENDTGDFYRIYAYYQKINDDSERGYHFDLFFNIQNLFKPPFEYISTVTGQPAPAILPDSYLYLPGDRESLKKTEAGKLTIYGQMKYLINDITASVKTIPLVTYDIYNISDDKPKFFIKKSDRVLHLPETMPTIVLKFEDVHINAPTITTTDGKITFRDVVKVTQPVSVYYNNDLSNDQNQLTKLDYTLIHNYIKPLQPDQGVPHINLEASQSYIDDERYPFRYNPKYQSILQKNETTYPVSYTYQDSGYTNEDMYLQWELPPGTDIIDLYKKLGCLVVTTATKASAKLKSGNNAIVKVIPGRIYIDNITGGNEYLGKEHGKNLTKYGYIINKVSNGFKILLKENQS